MVNYQFTLPSSMGLSLMCTTGPGWVLVDLFGVSETEKTASIEDQCADIAKW